MIRKTTRRGVTIYKVRVGHGAAQRTFFNKKDADEYEAEEKKARLRERAGLEPEAKGPITFAALCELYEANFDPSEWRLHMLRRPKDRWGKVFVRTIQPEALGKWLHDLPLSDKTKSHILETMRRVLNAGVEWGYLSKSPARRGAFKAPAGKRVRPINPFESWAEVVAMADACDGIDGHSGRLVRFVCSTGLTSPSEWRNATWGDINFAEKTMTVHGTKTTNRQRTIPLSATALEALEELPRGLPHTLVFQSKTGKAFDYENWRKLVWPKALEKIGASPRTPNEMRHTFAVLALQSGVPIDAVADLLGHSDVAITYRYYRKWTRSMANQARALLDTWGAEKGDEADAGH